MTKRDRLLQVLKHRWVTVQVSMRCAGIASLSQRVTQWEREDGLKFDRKWITANGSRFLAYKLRVARPDRCEAS